jgi:branched-subunit amino acid aminotransferase/4-amino-4-deoxychorismate lyase
MSILEATMEAGIACFEERLKPQLLFESDELFFASTPFKVLPIKQINDRKLDHAPGPVTRRIASLMAKIADGSDARFKAWLYMLE